MGKSKLKYYRVLNMVEAIGLIEGNDLLDVRTNLALSRMRSHGADVSQSFYEIINQKELQLVEETKGKSADDIQKLNSDFVKERERVAITEDTEEWDYPDLKVTQFEAQHDMVRAGGRTYKKGESLVPTKFFILMGDLITE